MPVAQVSFRDAIDASVRRGERIAVQKILVIVGILLCLNQVTESEDGQKD